MFILNKACKYCVACDLIITKQSEIEQQLTVGLLEIDPGIIGNDYLVMGTLDRKDWRKREKESSSPSETLKKMYAFKNHLDFEVIPAGWYLSFLIKELP